MNAIIYQLPIESNNIFRGYSKEKFDFSEYKKVYEWDIANEAIECADDNKLLEDIFYIFHCQHPKDFKGHSLSVSDIVRLNNRFYYCNDLGWKDITDNVINDILNSI